MTEPSPQPADIKMSQTYKKDQVVSIINSVIEKVQHSDGAPRDAIHKELEDLKNLIVEARTQISLTNPEDIKGKHIPVATDELDAVVGATEEATGTIMDSCEVIQKHLGSMTDDVRQDIEGEIIKIFEACSFQDITGQRITKVVESLRLIEEKVSAILNFLDSSAAVSGESATEKRVGTGEEKLLNGPQMPDKAITQDDIDKLLAEFDN